jgi:hypothetical protein
MRLPLRSHLSYANVVSTVCLFVLLGGTAVAVDGSLPGQNTVGSADIINGEIKNTDLGSDSVNSGKIMDGAVKNSDLGPNAASSNTIADGGVRGIDIGNGQLTGADIGNDSLTGADVADIISSGGVTQVEAGGERTLLQEGPFTVTAHCELLPSPDWPPGTLFATTLITSSEEHSVVDVTGQGSIELPPGGFGVAAQNANPEWTGGHMFAGAPSGATLHGHIGIGVHTLGYDDCTAEVTAIGTSELRQ